MLTRRRFLGYAGFGAAAVAARSLLAGRPSATEAAGTTLNVGEWVGATTLDPDVENADNVLGFLRNVYEPLVDLNGSSMRTGGVLASRWRVSEDAREYTFELLRNVKFSDGTPFDAAAAKASVERIIEMKKGPYWVVQQIADVETRGDYTLVIRLSKVFPLLSAMRLVPMISPAVLASKATHGDHAQEWLSDHSGGTGAYVVDHWARGREWTLAKNRLWRDWRSREAVHTTFDTVVVRQILEPSTQTLMLKGGDLDIALLYNQESIAELKRTPGVVVRDTPNLQQLYVRLNNVAGPTKDVKVRQALNYAWDPKGLNAVLPGAFTSSDGPIPHELLGTHSPKLPYEYNLDKARQLLVTAGYPNGGFKLTYWSVKGDEVKRLTGELLQAQLAKLNITLETTVTTWPAQYEALSEWVKTRNPDKATSMFPLLTGPRFPDAYAIAWFMYSVAAASGDGRNWGYYANPAVDDLISRGAALASKPTAEQEIYGEVASAVLEAAPDIFCGKYVMTIPMRASVHGYVPRPANSRQILFYDLWRA